MNIGIFTDTYHPQINGVVSSIKTLEKELTKLGHNVYIFTISYPKIENDSENVHRIPSVPFLFFKAHRVAALYSHKTMKTIKSLNLDIIHTQTEFSLGIFGKIVSKKLGIPVVHTYHTIWENYVHYVTRKKNNKITPKLVRKMSKFYCNHFKAIVAPTEKTKQLLINYGVKKNIEVIPTGIDIKPFQKSNFPEHEILDLKKQFNITPSDPIVLFVGRVSKEKSIDVIIEQMPSLIQKLPVAKLVIVGDGPEKKELHKLCDKLNISDSVIFTGQQPWENISKFYQLGDVFVSASITETQGLTFIEAMSGEIPVVARYDKSLDNVLEDKINGRFFYKSEELSDILFETLTNKDITAKLCENALITANQFSSENFGKKVESLYKSLVNNI